MVARRQCDSFSEAGDEDVSLPLLRESKDVLELEYLEFQIIAAGQTFHGRQKFNCSYWAIFTDYSAANCVGLRRAMQSTSSGAMP